MPSSLPPLASLIDPESSSGSTGPGSSPEEAKVAVGPRTRAIYRDVVTAQVKTMSFLAYTLRNFSELTAAHQHAIPGWVVLLLRRVPPEASSTRKELLVAARHILSTEYRMLFTRQIDALLHDRVLLGCGYTAHENLRPLAYSMLADLVHHVRQHLTPQQLSRSVHLFTCNMHDETLPHSIQTMCCKLLLNIIDSLPNLSDRALGQNLMMTILVAFRDKLRMLSRSRGQVIMDDAEGKGAGQISSEEGEGPSIAITTGQVTPHTVREARFLFRNLLGGVKTILHTLRHLPAMEGSRGREGKWRVQEDADILRGIFEDGLSCFYYYYHPRFSTKAASSITGDSETSGSTRSTSSSGEDLGVEAELSPSDETEAREAIEVFSGIWLGMDGPMFQEVLHPPDQVSFDKEKGPMGSLVRSIGHYPSLLAIPRILLRYLLVRLGRLGQPGIEGRRLLSLWNLIFSSYKVYPEANEALLLPHVGSLIVRCMRLAQPQEDGGIRYYLLLKSLFRTIGSGRYEALYHEVAPLMHFMLEGFNDLLLQSTSARREVYVELCLTVPVRLNGLLPFIQYLIRPLTLALGSKRNPELSGQGLRTLELCIDHLTPVFLEPILAPVSPKLMKALWRHLQPLGISRAKGEAGSSPEGHALSAQRILGKLGGRNRSILYEPEGGEGGEEMEEWEEEEGNGWGNPADWEGVFGVWTPKRSGQTSSHFDQESSEKVILGWDSLASEDQDDVDKAIEVIGRVLEWVVKESEVDGENDVSVGGIPGQEREGLRVLRETLPQALDGEEAAGMDKEALLQEERIRWRRRRIRWLIGRLSSILLEGMWRKGRTKDPRVETMDEEEEQRRAKARAYLIRSIQWLAVSSQTPSISSGQRQWRQRLLLDLLEGTLSAPCMAIRAEGEVFLQEDILAHAPLSPQIWEVLIERLSSQCWRAETGGLGRRRRGGGQGGPVSALRVTLSVIKSLSEENALPIGWLKRREPDFLRALLQSCKERANAIVQKSSGEVDTEMKEVNDPWNEAADQTLVVSLLVSELASPHAAVRGQTLRLLRLLSLRQGNQATSGRRGIGALVGPVRDVLLQPIFNKPLRALPLQMQIGCVSAVAVCLELDESEEAGSSCSDQVLRLLHETVALADAEDRAMVTRLHYRHTGLLIHLRVACLRMLGAAIRRKNFVGPRQAATRARIIAVCFKSLYSPNRTVMLAADRALRGILGKQPKLPKDMLQQALRPVLENLSDHRRLTTTVLSGLTRLLEMMTNYFKPEIGRKLFDHLRAWAGDTVLNRVCGLCLEEDVPEIQIIRGILEVIPLLPGATDVLLNPLIGECMRIEQGLGRASASSPCRPALCRFILRHPDPSLTMILGTGKPITSEQRAFFLGLVGTDESSAENLRAMIRGSGTLALIQLVASQKEKDEGEEWVLKEGLEGSAVEYFLLMVGILVQGSDGMMWMRSEASLRSILRMVWDQWSRKLFLPVDDKDRRRRLCLSLQSLFISLHSGGAEKPRERVQWLLSLLDLACSDSKVRDDEIIQHDHSLLEVIFLGENSRLHGISEDSLEWSDKEERRSLMIWVLSILVNPLIRHLLKHRDLAWVKRVMTRDILDTLQKKVWIEGNKRHWILEDELRMHILQFTASVLEHAPALLADKRKDMIKFGWACTKCEDVTAKQAAYVLLARFIAAYESPHKIITQIWLALLRAPATEARALVRQAMDILLPVLPLRLKGEPSSGSLVVPNWIRLARRMVIDEAFQAAQSSVILQLLSRHPEPLGPYANLFVDCILKALPRLTGLISLGGGERGLGGNGETRQLAGELIHLLWEWKGKIHLDRAGRRVLMSSMEEAELERRRAALGLSKAVPGNGGTVTRPPLPQMLAYRSLARKVVRVLRDLIMLTGPFTGTASERVSALMVSKVIVQACVQRRSTRKGLGKEEGADEGGDTMASGSEDKWVMLLISLGDKALIGSVEQRTSPGGVGEARILGSLIREIWQSIPKVKEEMMEAWWDRVDQAVGLSLNGMDSVHGGSVVSGLALIEAMHQQGGQGRAGEWVDGYASILIRHLTRLTKEHTTVSLISGSKSGKEGILIRRLLRLLGERISFLGEKRREILSVMRNLAEKSPSISLCAWMVRRTGEWVLGLEETGAFPTLKESTTLMYSLWTGLERRWREEEATRVDGFLGWVVRIYGDEGKRKGLLGSELTSRLEPAFLRGLLWSSLSGPAKEDEEIRQDFFKIYEASLPIDLEERLQHLFGVQSWEAIGAEPGWLVVIIGTMTTGWIRQVQDSMVLSPGMTRDEVGGLERLVLDSIRDHLVQLVGLSIGHPEVAYRWWKEGIFPWVWAHSQNSSGICKALADCLSQPWHQSQATQRPNAIQGILGGLAQVAITKGFYVRMPPQLIKWAGSTYNAWYEAVLLLENESGESRKNEDPEKKDDLDKAQLEALAAMYEELGEQGMGYGLWRRRSIYSCTGRALALEMAGKWAEAQAEWEMAQIHARAAGTADPRLRPTEAALWESRWTACTGELQQWDLLADVARHDMSASLTMKAAWRLGLGGFGSGNADGTEERDGLRTALLSVPETSQTCAMEATLHLADILTQRDDTQSHSREEARAAYHRACERSVHLALSEWWALPHHRVGKGHLAALRSLQQLVEVQEAGRLTLILMDVGVGGFEERIQELRPILTSWRERLPLEWEPVGQVWSDLMAWRQRMYGLMNRVLLPLVPLLSAADTSANSLAYRGYHETAWMINRFARVARKHGLREVCSAQLARIYTLPNIEIAEAFVKLREQARCHFRGGGWADVASGLEVISHTNLMYFTPKQKAEFFALKGAFMDKLGLPVDGVKATMVQATRLDVGHAKAWVAWGRLNDRLAGLPDIPDAERTTYAVGALECYMQATIIQREAKARRYIARILWLLGMDISPGGEVGKAFETFTEEIPIWYWLTFLPQLLVSLGYREARQVRLILIKMSKAFPQALHYHLRTAREELAWMRHGGGRKHAGGPDARGRRENKKESLVDGATKKDEKSKEDAVQEDEPMKDAESIKQEDERKKERSGDEAQKKDAPTEARKPDDSQSSQPPKPPSPAFRTALDHVEEVMSMLKTAFPLLALTVETMSGQLVSRLKPSSEEDLYRLICALLYDATQHLAMRLSSGGKDMTLPSPTIAHIRRFADSMARGSLRDAFIRAFGMSHCGHLPTHVLRLRRWKREFERYLDAQPTLIPLETLSTYLADFEHQRFEDVEIPGQYLLLRDASTHFVKLERFESVVEVIRDAGACSRRLRIRGQDGSVHRLLLQHPTPRVVRREERMQQFLRLMNHLLARRWPARSMALAFHLPLMIPLSPAVRIIMEPLGPYRSLLEIAEEEAGRRGVDRDAAVRYFLSGLDEAVRLLPASTLMSPSKLAGVVRGIRVDLMSELLSSSLSPSMTLSRWVERRMRSPTDLWLYRRRFTEHLAVASFTTYLLGLGYRYPSRMRISLETGAIHCLESHPSK
ncbi:MAG: hypothetical protein DHS80DRAFT_12039 [Piptocephalis tieghemiana]|nr:MAG: hypothetical protein DHS80DRAFT_12039 [Piptocephalis tieghemiana]